MIDIKKNFTESAQITLNQRAFLLREGEKYRNFSERFQVRTGNIVSENFLGASTEFKVRVKSPESIKIKALKNAKAYAEKQRYSEEILDINNFSLYDIYGGKFVVLSVSDDFSSPHISIDGYLENRKKSRAKLNKALTLEKTYPSKEHEKISELSHIIYNMIDTTCHRAIAEAICNFIINCKELKEEFGIYNIESRFRNYNTKNEYIAQHVTLGSTKLPGWYMELQFKSLQDYEIARTGEASHLTRDGKAIPIPSSFSNLNMDSIPEYWVYIPNGLYIPSQKECAFHYLLAAFYQRNGFRENPKKLLELFKEFEDTGIFKNF